MAERKEARLKKNIRVKLKDDTGTYDGMITSLSKSGMRIKTEHIFPTYKVIDILVKIGEKMVQLRGSVRWVYEPFIDPDAAAGTDTDFHADADPEDRMYQIGVSLHNPPPEYIQHFE
jgi:Tfp pilus assembly protein PilZ